MRIARALGVFAVVLSVGAALVVLGPIAVAQWDAHGPRVRSGFARLGDFGSGSEIGASVRDVAPADVGRAKLPTQAGAMIESVRSEGPAARAGLQSGDVIVEFDGERVRSARQVVRLVRETPAGRTVRIAIVRDGRRTELDVTPAAAPDGPMAWGGGAFDEPLRNFADLGRHFDMDLNREVDGAMFGKGRLGVTIEELTPQLAMFFGVKDGVLVSSVREGDSPAARAGIKAGDVITAANQQPVTSAHELMRILHDIEDGQEVSLDLVRDRKVMTAKATLEGANPGRGRRARLRPA